MSREDDERDTGRGALLGQEKTRDSSDAAQTTGADAANSASVAPEATEDDPPSDVARPATANQSASDVAWALAELVPAIPEQTATNLKRLLSRSLTNPTPAERREARLGLLIELVSDGRGEVPSVADYEEKRRERTAQGEEWPANSTLIRAYGGHWLRAVRAAMRVAFDGNEARASDSDHGLHSPSTHYTRGEVAEAVGHCWRDLGLAESGPGPSRAEYMEWVALNRKAARLSGQPEPRLPTHGPVSRLWGSWEAVILAARPEAAPGS